MFLEKNHKFTKTLSFRLTIWYAGIFTISCFLAFAVFYFGIHSLTIARLDEEMIEEVEEFKDVLEKETLGSEELVRQKVNEKYQKIEQELEEYKRIQFEKLDESIYRVLAKITKEIVGEAVSLEGQQELVMRVLEEAKKEGSLQNV